METLIVFAHYNGKISFSLLTPKVKFELIHREKSGMRKVGLFSLLVMISCFAFSTPKREMKGVWIATIANIDWPSKKDLSVNIQKREMLLLLDSLSRVGINTVVFQCRPMADALYKSPFEPWSEYVTGIQGKAPDEKGYDPLEFVVEEAHKRCMEVHAWVNPYRVTNGPEARLASDHIYYKRPELFCSYGGKICFNPGLKETEEYLLKILRDIVVRYDIDGLHLDDYFYPYPVGGQDFPDEQTFRKDPRGFSNKADWRRDNVSHTIRTIQDMIKKEKPWVQFGVSPFGVWRNQAKDPNGSKTKAGVTNYDDLYADVLLWAQKGWIDYIVPQLYWEIGMKAADYATLAPWWRKNIPTTCNLYFGLFASGLEVNKTKAWKTPNELIRQMRYNEECVNIDGLFFYSNRYLLRGPQGLLDSLRGMNYYEKTLTMSCKNASEAFPPLNLHWEGDTLCWDKVIAEGGDVVSYYVVYSFPDTDKCDLDDARYILAKTTDCRIKIDSSTREKNTYYNYTVTAVNRYRSESEPYDFVTYNPYYKELMNGKTDNTDNIESDGEERVDIKEVTPEKKKAKNKMKQEKSNRRKNKRKR